MSRHFLRALVGLAIGIVIGLVIGWGLWPVQFTNADPSDLRTSYKDESVRMIAAAYAKSGDLAQAKLRLSQLYRGTPSQTINDFISRENRKSTAKIQMALVDLSWALAPPSAVQRSTVVPTSVSVPAVAAEATPATLPLFQVVEQTQISCSDESEQAYIRLYVRGPDGRDLPNVAIEIRWASGDDTVYTGLKPERGLGYADLVVQPGTYTVSILNASSDTASLSLAIGPAPADCKADRAMTPRGWKLVFQQR